MRATLLAEILARRVGYTPEWLAADKSAGVGLAAIVRALPRSGRAAARPGAAARSSSASSTSRAEPGPGAGGARAGRVQADRQATGGSAPARTPVGAPPPPGSTRADPLRDRAGRRRHGREDRADREPLAGPRRIHRSHRRLPAPAIRSSPSRRGCASRRRTSSISRTRCCWRCRARCSSRSNSSCSTVPLERARHRLGILGRRDLARLRCDQHRVRRDRRGFRQHRRTSLKAAVTFSRPTAHRPPRRRSNGIDGYWLRARLTQPLPPDPGPVAARSRHHPAVEHSQRRAAGTHRRRQGGRRAARWPLERPFLLA